MEGEFIEWFFWTLMEAGIIAVAQGAALFTAVRIYRVLYPETDDTEEMDRLDRMDERLDDQDERLDSFSERLDSIDAALNALLEKQKGSRGR